MKHFKTNLALALELLDIGSAEFLQETGADKAMLSRWRNGRRQLVPGQKWVKRISDYLVKKDGLAQNSVLRTLLRELYPLDGGSPDEAREYLAHWLSEPAQAGEGPALRRSVLYARVLSTTLPQGQGAQAGSANFAATGARPVRSVAGLAETRRLLSALVNYVNARKDPVEIDFVCGGGIELVTRDEAFGIDIMRRIAAMLKKGHSINVLLRTDFKVSDIAAFSGLWLAAVMSGNIHCRYYDDFSNADPVKILVYIRGLRAYRIYGEDYRCEIYRDRESLNQIGEECRHRMAMGEALFRYRIFEQPQGYLSWVRLPCQGPSWLIQRLPHFSVGGAELLNSLKLRRHETDYLQAHFSPLLVKPQQLTPKHSVCHIFCREDVLEALEKPRHMHFCFKHMLGRAVYMNTQVLVDQLIEIQHLLQTMENYHVCFADRAFFRRAGLELAVWGKEAALGWTEEYRAGATLDALNSAALNGFCATLWNQLPQQQRSRKAALAILNELLPEK